MAMLHANRSLRFSVPARIPELCAPVRHLALIKSNSLVNIRLGLRTSTQHNRGTTSRSLSAANLSCKAPQTMTLIGFSILVASFTVLCYRHLPMSWRFPSWTRLATLGTREAAVVAPAVVEEHHVEPYQTAALESLAPIEKQTDPDRIAMPPPPTFKKPAVQTTPPIVPAATQTNDPSKPDIALSSVPSPLPSFPALNSAQRASGGRGPPTLNPIPVRQPPLRSPSLLSPPIRSPIPNRGPSMSSTLAPPPTHNSIPTKPRKKVLLRPGHSPLDWAHLSNSPNSNLNGLPPSTLYLRVPPSLLRQHTGRKGKDAWTVLGGKVFNITPYLPYHPGGEPELMKAAGRDGTKLFGEVHPWVNWENMLESCLVGVAVGEDEVPTHLLEEMD